MSAVMGAGALWMLELRVKAIDYVRLRDPIVTDPWVRTAPARAQPSGYFGADRHLVS